MPKDQWATTKQRDAVRRSKARQDHAMRQGELADCWLGRSVAHQRGLDVKSMTRQQLAALGAQALLDAPKDKPPKIKANTPCPRCGSLLKSVKTRVFKDGGIHDQVDCGKCRKFLKWGKA